MLTRNNFLWRQVVLSGLIPAAHWLLLVATEIERHLIFPRVVGFFAWLGLGLAFYLTHFPESVWPGRFDVLGHSHQWWHFSVSAAAL